MEKKKRIVKSTPKKKPFILKHYKSIIFGLGFIILFQFMQGCLRNSSHEREIKKIVHINDSIQNKKDLLILEKDSIIKVQKEDIIYLEYELKVAGVKVDAAEARAKAVQKTAEKIKQNTTIKIQADTSKTKIN